jgi:ABC-type sugar transport system ATPase subunit
MSVRQNIAFGLRMRKVTKAEQHRRVEEIAQILGLTEHLDRRPARRPPRRPRARGRHQGE